MAETTATTKVKPKKKQKRIVAAGEVHIQASFNNTIITVTDKKGDTLTASSAGATGFRGSKKGTAYAAQVASEKALNQAKQQFGLASVEVFVGGIGLGREAAIRALQNVEVVVESIKDVTTIAHGGVRPRKPRRG
ncbi:MAG TPA: 30S ribosomal protein S11 [Candidatus Saccharimonadales bacterium]